MVKGIVEVNRDSITHTPRLTHLEFKDCTFGFKIRGRFKVNRDLCPLIHVVFSYLEFKDCSLGHKF